MHRVDTESAVAALPAPEATGDPGFFTKGDPVGSVPATSPGPDWCNMVQEELVAILTAFGVSPDQTKTDFGQLADALLANLANITGNASQIFRAAQAVGDNDVMPMAQIVASLMVRRAVRTVATTNIVLSGEQTISGVACVAGDEVLAAGQVAATENGPYVVVAGGAWTRRDDADASALFIPRMQIPVSEGDHAETVWWLTNTGAITLGTTGLVFNKIIGWATVDQILAGTAADVAVTPAGLATGQLLALNGYKKFPGGMILQWGSVPAGAAVGEAVPVVFPVTFPVAFGRAVVTTNMATTANIGTWVDSPSQSGMNVRSGVGNVGASIYWFAIGY